MKTMAALIITAGLTFAAAKQEAPKPEKEHEWLKQFEGTWDFTTQFGTETGKGVETAALGCGGLWLIVDAKEDKKDGFHGHGVVGYDTSKKKFVNLWVDSMSTYAQIMEGTLDKDGKVLTVEGDAPGMDGKMAHWKWVIAVNDKDHRSLTFYTVADKKETKLGAIEYTRAKK